MTSGGPSGSTDLFAVWICSNPGKPIQVRDILADGSIGSSLYYTYTNVLGVPRVEHILSDELVVIAVRADPEPNEINTGLDRECAVVESYPCGPEAADLLEMKGRVPRISFQVFVDRSAAR